MIVDDEDTVQDCIKSILQIHGFLVLQAWDSHQALNLAREHHPSLILLDINLGDGETGLDLCKQFRSIQDNPFLKIIVVSGLVHSHYKTSAYNCGVDGYLTKPFEPNELIALVKAQLREHLQSDEGGQSSTSDIQLSKEENESTKIDKYGFSVDVSRSHVWCDGKLIKTLSPNEFGVLLCLLRHSPKIVTRKMFLEEVWNDSEVETRTIDVHISRLKCKLPPSAADKIVSKPKLGYRIIT